MVTKTPLPCEAAMGKRRGKGGGCSSRTEANGTKRRVNYFVKHPGIKVRPAVVFLVIFVVVRW